MINDPAYLTAWQAAIRRRAFLKNSVYGLGGIALAGLLDPSLTRATSRAADTARSADRWRGVLNPPHRPIKARRVIHLCMAGGPSQFESFDYKPRLKELHGQPFPASFTKGQQLAQLQNTVLKARGPACGFQRHGQSGQEISDLFPHIAGIADRICIVRSMTTEQINHDPAHAFMNTGSIIKGRPSMGSGSCTDWGPRPTTCLDSSSSPRPAPAGSSRYQFASGRRESCPASSRASSSSPGATPFITSPVRPELIGSFSG